MHQILYKVVMLAVWLLGLPVEALHNGQEIIDLAPELSVYGLLALVLQLSEVHLRGELEPAGTPWPAPVDLVLDLVAALVDRLKDAPLEVSVVGFKRVLQVIAELGSLQDCE